MKLFRTIILLTAGLLMLSCGTALKLSPDEMLEASGRDIMPVQENYPEAGGVILYEDFKDKLYLDGDWNVNVEQTVHRAVLYFNDKAEDWTTVSIYLDPEITLVNFYARTIKANGEVLELSKKDLHKTKLGEYIAEFSDDESVKFTFPSVEPGAVLEYGYKVNKRRFYSGNKWYVQSGLPKLYTKMTVELPNIFFKYDNNWTYSSNNFDLGAPEVYKNLVNQQSDKDRSRIYYWELTDIPALEYEPNCPPYNEIADYVSLDIQYDNWNDLTKRYWKLIKEYFIPEKSDFSSTANEVAGDAAEDYTKIKRVFDYTQREFRYLAVNIDDSGIIPHTVGSIIKNKYGDCKDMTVLNVVLLKALGFEAYPALVNTRGRGDNPTNLVSLDFNHMIAYVKDSEGKEYWLDATGSSCPLGEIPSSIEGVNALIIYSDGKSKFKKIPMSKYSDNCIARKVSYEISKDGNISGRAELTFNGNENLYMRSRFKDASKKDMKEILEGYVNSNTPDIKIDSLIYDDPSVIADEYHITILFSKKNLGQKTGNLFIFKPSLFTVESRLDKYKDIKRKYAVRYYAPFSVKDEVNINYDADVFTAKAAGNVIRENFKFGSFSAVTRNTEPGKITFKRDYQIKNFNIPASHYNDFRKIHQTIAAANNENIVLEYK